MCLCVGGVCVNLTCICVILKKLDDHCLDDMKKLRVNTLTVCACALFWWTRRYHVGPCSLLEVSPGTPWGDGVQKGGWQ